MLQGIIARATTESDDPSTAKITFTAVPFSTAAAATTPCQK